MNPGQTSVIALLLPLVAFVVLVYTILRRQRQSFAKIDVSMDMSRRGLEIAEENLVLSRETNRLLEELIVAVQESR